MSNLKENKFVYLISSSVSLEKPGKICDIDSYAGDIQPVVLRKIASSKSPRTFHKQLPSKIILPKKEKGNKKRNEKRKLSYCITPVSITTTISHPQALSPSSSYYHVLSRLTPIPVPIIQAPSSIQSLSQKAAPITSKKKKENENRQLTDLIKPASLDTITTLNTLTTITTTESRASSSTSSDCYTLSTTSPVNSSIQLLSQNPVPITHFALNTISTKKERKNPPYYTGTQITQGGEPVKTVDECNNNDIGLNFKTSNDVNSNRQKIHFSVPSTINLLKRQKTITKFHSQYSSDPFTLPTDHIPKPPIMQAAASSTQSLSQNTEPIIHVAPITVSTNKKIASLKSSRDLHERFIFPKWTKGNENQELTDMIKPAASLNGLTTLPLTSTTACHSQLSLATNSDYYALSTLTPMPVPIMQVPSSIQNTAPITIAHVSSHVKNCKKLCCSGVKKVPRGAPVKAVDECDPNDIGLHFRTIGDLSDAQKYELIKKHWKPPKNFKFPQHVDGKRHWRFNADYIDKTSEKWLPWLAYSAYYDGVFCIPCVLFGHNFGNTRLVKLWKEPFTRWNGAPTRWREHSSSSVHGNIHQSSLLHLHSFVMEMEGIKRREEKEKKKKRIATKLIPDDRKKMIPIFKTIVLCGRQNIPLQMDDLNDPRNPNNPSATTGNIRALLKYKMDIEAAPVAIPTTQNEIIDCCKIYIQEKLLDEIRGNYFAIIADEASDSSNEGQLALLLRFIDKSGEIREDFLEFIKCPSLESCDIAELILDTITNKYKLDMKMCVGQCYDGASNISGVLPDVASIITAEYPNALYFNSASSHRLSLLVASSCQPEDEQSIKNMMESIKKTHDIFQLSSNKEFLFGQCIREELLEETREKLIDLLCGTEQSRRESILRSEGMQRFHELLGPIITCLNRISNNWDKSYTAEARLIAGGLKTNIERFDFIIALVVVRHVLAYIQPLTYELEQLKIDIFAVYEAVDNNLETLKKVRDKIDKNHHEWFEQAVSLSQKMNVPVKIHRICGFKTQPNSRKRVEEYYRLSLTTVLLDEMINQLEERFSSSHRIHGQSFFAIPSRVVTDKNWKFHIMSCGDNDKCFTHLYKNLLPNYSILVEEMEVWETYWCNLYQKEGKVPDNICEALKASVLKKNWFPNLFSILLIAGAVPSSSKSCERSMSKLGLIKTYLRSETMEQDRLNGLTLIHAHYDVDIDFKALLGIFAQKFSRRLRLEDNFDDDDDVP